MSKVANIEFYYKAVGAGGFKLNVVGPKVIQHFQLNSQFNSTMINVEIYI